MGLKAPEPNTKYAFSASALFVQSPFECSRNENFKKKRLLFNVASKSSGGAGGVFHNFSVRGLLNYKYSLFFNKYRIKHTGMKL